MADARADAAWPDLAGSIVGREHILPVRVYYEDTDFSGAVYHANYLKFCERGRSDFLRMIGVEHRALLAGEMEQRSYGFVARRMVVDFHRPAAIDELLEVRTRFRAARGARLHLDQRISRDGEMVFTAEVTIALVDAAGRPARIPAALSERLAPFVSPSGEDCDGAP